MNGRMVDHFIANGVIELAVRFEERGKMVIQRLSSRGVPGQDPAPRTHPPLRQLYISHPGATPLLSQVIAIAASPAKLPSCHSPAVLVRLAPLSIHPRNAQFVLVRRRRAWLNSYISKRLCCSMGRYIAWFVIRSNLCPPSPLVRCCCTPKTAAEPYCA